jgi:hypothetical protein
MVDALRLRRIGDELAYAFSHAGDTFARQAALDLVESAATLDRRSATSTASMAFRVRGGRHFPATVGGDRLASADCRGRRWSAELRSVSDQAAANYRKRAAECAAAASTTKNPETRTQLVMLAEKWVKLAEQREHSVATHGTGPPRQPRER